MRDIADKAETVAGAAVSAVRAAAVEPGGLLPPASIAPTEAAAAVHIHGLRAKAWASL